MNIIFLYLQFRIENNADFQLFIKKIKSNEKSKLLKQNYYGCVNSGVKIVKIQILKITYDGD